MERKYSFSSEFDDEDFEVNGEYLDFVDVDDDLKNAVILTKYDKSGVLEEVVQGVPQIKEYLKRLEDGNKN
jgi:hypothetical protein